MTGAYFSTTQLLPSFTKSLSSIHKLFFLQDSLLLVSRLAVRHQVEHVPGKGWSSEVQWDLLKMYTHWSVPRFLLYMFNSIIGPYLEIKFSLSLSLCCLTARTTRATMPPANGFRIGNGFRLKGRGSKDQDKEWKEGKHQMETTSLAKKT